jgi:nicotinamide-nucleotide amidase
MKAEIITIGNEILIGQVIDTNSAWMGESLNTIGIDIVQITSIGDDKLQLHEAINAARKRVNIILLTGGLGPTRDDLTKHALAEYYGCGFKSHEPTLNHIKLILERRGIALKQNNIDQAEVPEACEAMFNENGTAPGMWFEKDGLILASMPGVPYEMKGLMKSFVLPRLKEKFGLAPVLHRTFLTVNVPESELSYKLEAFEDGLPQGITLAYLPHMNTVRLRLSARAKNELHASNLLEQESNKLMSILGGDIASTEGKPMNEVIVEWLSNAKLTLATAESCTGGYIAHKITSVPGSSAVFAGSVVSYANEIKMNQLGVNKAILESEGAVSEACVKAMVEGICDRFRTEVGIATSGIAGPGGGTDKKPVGTVWIAVKIGERIETHRALFHGGRLAIIERSCLKAFDMLWKMMLPS